MTATTNMHAEQSRRVLTWTIASVAILAVLLLGLIARVAQLKIAPDPQLPEAAGDATSHHPEYASRGDIVDCRGRVIATSSIGFRLFIDPQTVEDLGTLAPRLGSAMGVSPVEIDRKISQRPESRYVVVSQLLSDSQVDAVRKLALRGVGLEPRLVRHYLYEDIAAMLVGDVGFEHTGRAGVEFTHNQELSPRDGKLTYLRDASRRVLWVQPTGFQPGQDGKPVRLTIDLVVQQMAQERLAKAVREYNAGGGRMVVLDCASGDLLAMCDILNPRKGWDEFTSDAVRKTNPALGRNRCVTDPYEPGSTFKPFIWSVATELGKAKPEEVLPTPSPGDGPWRTTRGRQVRDAHSYGPSTWRTVLVKSINAGMAMVSERMSPTQMREAIARFGFGYKTNCGLPGESPGIVTSAKAWTTYSQVSVSYGHEIAVTPVQMVRAFSAFATGGTLPALRFTLPFEDGPGPLDHSPVDPEIDPAMPLSSASLVSRVSQRPGAPPAGYESVHRVLPESIVQLTREALRDVMTEGTGRMAQSEKYQLFGKSGTAQLPKKSGKGYHEDRYVASFIAGAPFNEPRIVVLCVLDDPDRSKGHFGGAIAGPAVRDVIESTLEYLGVPAELASKAGAKSAKVAAAD